MNTSTALPLIDHTQYRDSMQQAALGFLQRHQAEHLGDDAQLFERATGYMVNTLDVPLFMAQRLVHLAMSELPDHPRVGIDIASGTDHTVLVLIDTRTGERVITPRRILPTRFLATHTQ